MFGNLLKWFKSCWKNFLKENSCRDLKKDLKFATNYFNLNYFITALALRYIN